MGDLWIQVLTKDARDLGTLDAQLRPKFIAEDVVGYLQLLESEPQSVALHDDLAGMYLDLGRPDDAVVQFEASARLKPDVAATHFNLGLALTLAGKLDDAIEQYRRALDIEPDYALAHNNLGGILLERGHAGEALEHLREAVRLDPTNAAALNNLGVARRDRGEEAEAIDDFRRSVLASPNWAPAIVNLAWMLATASDGRLRNAELGVRLAARAADLTERRDPRALDVLAAAYASAGDFDRAIDAARAALQLAPEGAAAAEIQARQELYSRHEPYRRAAPQK
jgi:spermidine synthase